MNAAGGVGGSSRGGEARMEFLRRTQRWRLDEEERESLLRAMDSRDMATREVRRVLIIYLLCTDSGPQTNPVRLSPSQPTV